MSRSYKEIYESLLSLDIDDFEHEFERLDPFDDLNQFNNFSEDQKDSMLNHLNNEKNINLDKNQLNEVLNTIKEKNFLNISDIINKTASINNDIQSIPISQVEAIYFERKVKPLLDIIFSLSYQIENLAAASSFYQANAYGKKHKVKKAVQLSNEMVDIMEDILCLVKKRIQAFKRKVNPYD